MSDPSLPDASEAPPTFEISLPPLRGSKDPIVHRLAPWGAPDRLPLPQRAPRNAREVAMMSKAVRVIGGAK